MRRIEIYDTTLRDGAQGEGVSFSLQDKLALTERLDRLGFDYVEGGYPASNEKDFQYFQRVGQLGLKHAKVCAFGMTRRKGVARRSRRRPEGPARCRHGRHHAGGQGLGLPGHRSAADHAATRTWP